MARTTFTHLYDTYEEAAAAVRALEVNGVPHGDVSIVSNDPVAHESVPDYTPPDTGAQGGSAAGTGATLGTVIGGGAGLLAGLGALAIPGVGPIVAAGWLIAAVTGAGAGAGVGSLLGSLIGLGVHHDDAQVYSEAVRRGGTLVAVHADEARASEIARLLETFDAVDIKRRRDNYTATGWQEHDATAPLYGRAEVEAERVRVRGENI